MNRTQWQSTLAFAGMLLAAMCLAIRSVPAATDLVLGGGLVPGPWFWIECVCALVIIVAAIWGASKHTTATAWLATVLAIPVIVVLCVGLTTDEFTWKPVTALQLIAAGCVLASRAVARGLAGPGD